MKKKIKIKFQNGINNEIALKDILLELKDVYEFLETEQPDFILFGPYGNDIPKKGNYTRIGYYCENILPDFSNCEWAFGILREEDVNRKNYKRIFWHGLSPKDLIKKYDENEIDRIIDSKTKFCNFIYSNKISYREDFFKQLSKYKKIDAPGRSMNNMNSIDDLYKGDVWERKRNFLTNYKFTIAFENYTYPGYQTEKLHDPMLVDSIPIYFGDPQISDIFNTKSFINASEYLSSKQNTFIKWIEKKSQPDFIDIRPDFYRNPYHRLKRKIKTVGRTFKTKQQFKNIDYNNLIEHIISIDKNIDLYKKYLSEPWFVNNEEPSIISNKARWVEIFNSNA